MPYIEPESGDVSHGVGGGNASLNNVAFSPGGVGGWRDRDRVVFANGADGWTVSTYDKVTGAVERVLFPDAASVAAASPVNRPFSRSLLRSLLSTPANVSYAGGGHVSCWLGAKGGERGLYSTVGMRDTEAGLLGMGPDGSVGYKPLYYSYGPTRVREADGRDWLLTEGHASALQLLGGGRAIWMEGFTVRVAGLPQAQRVAGGGVWKAQAAFVGGEWWTCYFSSDKGIVLHPFRSAEAAFPILPVGDGWHAIAAVGPDTLRIAVAGHEGEQQGDVWGYDIDVRTGAAVPLPCWPGPPRKFDFVPVRAINPPPPVPVPTFAFSHRVLVAVFKDPDGMTPAPAEVLVNQNDQRRTRPVIVAADTLASRWKGELLGVYAEAPDPAAVLKLAEQRQTRLFLAWDSREPWALPRGLRAWDVPMLELYRHPGESLEQAVARWRRDAHAMVQAWPGDCGVVPMFYCMGGAAGGDPPEVWPVGAVLETLPYLNEIVALSPRIKVVAPFSYLRANGIIAHAELQQAYDNLLRAAPEVPALTPVGAATDPPPPPPPPPPPKREPMRIPHIGDDEIIELAGIYDAQPVNRPKDDGAYLRDAAYYGCGYVRLRAAGLTHEDARERYRDAAARDDYYHPDPGGMFSDEDVIALRERWTARYSATGRYQRQTRQENARDLTYWLISYARSREAGLGHEQSLRAMENGMARESGAELPFPPPPVGRIVPSGQWFVDGAGGIVVRRSITAFAAPKRFATGAEGDALRYLDWVAARQLNEVRAFARVDWTGPPGPGVEPGWKYDESACARLLAEAAARGLRVEMVAHTGRYGTVEEMAAHLRRVDELCLAHDNALLEAYNEPQQNGGHELVDRILDLYTPRTPGWATGVYDPTPYTPKGRAGAVMTYHSPRKEEWSRCAKDAYEYGTGQGPNVAFAPGFAGAVMLDEPPQVEQTVRDSGHVWDAREDWRAYGAGCALFGCGGTVHGNPSFQRCEVPGDPAVAACVDAFAAGVGDVPVQRYHGYFRGDPPGGNPGSRRYNRWGDDGRKYELCVRPYSFRAV